MKSRQGKRCRGKSAEEEKKEKCKWRGAVIRDRNDGAEWEDMTAEGRLDSTAGRLKRIQFNSGRICKTMTSLE